MNVLHNLSNVISKSGILKPRVEQYGFIMPQMFIESALKKRSRPRESGAETKVDVFALTEGNKRIVGKNSKYQRMRVKEHLSLVADRRLKRKDSCFNDQQYDKEGAKLQYQWEKRVNHDPGLKEIRIKKSSELLDKVLPLLIDLTRPYEFSEGNRTPSKRYLSYYNLEVPPVPNFVQHPNMFGSYIGLLTHTKFSHHNSSKLNGSIPNILRELMSPKNTKTMYLRNSECYNDMIYYYNRHNDLASARECLSQMKYENVCLPNTKTYNLMLYGLAFKQNLRKVQPINRELLYYLNDMKRQNIQADSMTWAICYKFIKEEQGKLLFLDAMQKLKLPVSQSMIESIICDIKDEVNHVDILRLIANNNCELTPKLSRIVLLKLMDVDMKKFWSFLRFVEGKNSGKSKAHSHIRLLLQIATSMMLRKFSDIGRVDQCLLVWKRYIEDQKITPEKKTIDLMFKSLVRNGYTKRFPDIYDFLIKLRRGHKIFGNTYWIMKCKAIIRFHYEDYDSKMRPSINSLEALLSRPGMATLDNIINPWASAESKKLVRYLGCLPKRLRIPSAQTMSTKSQSNFEVKAIKKRRYMLRVRGLAITHAMAKRIKNLQDNETHDSIK